MALRNIKKNLAGMQDLLCSRGVTVQSRNSANYNINGIDVPFAVDTVAEMQAIDVTQFSRARVYADVQNYTEYLYDVADSSGISSNTGAGTWVIDISKPITGTGTPEAAVTAPIGAQFMRRDGGASTTLYVKESGTGNTGWVAK